MPTALLACRWSAGFSECRNCRNPLTSRCHSIMRAPFKAPSSQSTDGAGLNNDSAAVILPKSTQTRSTVNKI